MWRAWVSVNTPAQMIERGLTRIHHFAPACEENVRDLHFTRPPLDPQSSRNFYRTPA